MLSGRPVGENWIISSSSDREASGASATLWLGMRVMALLTPGRGTQAGYGHREGRCSGRECDRRPGHATPEPGPGSIAGRPDGIAGQSDGIAGQSDGAVARRCHNPPGWFVLSGRAVAPAEPRCAAEGPGTAAEGPRMSETADGAKIVQAYRDHRPYLIDLAFRMLGDIGAAEDAVQDAFTRLLAADVGEIEDERGWLIVVTSRLCLDRIRSARARRERPHDAAEIEFVAPPAQGRLANPADRVTLDDSVSLALLVLLQRLSPAERVVFVLHDIFGVPFPAVAETVGRAAPACRQLARRARQKIAEGQSGARFDVAGAEHRAVTEKFIAACAS